MFQDTPFNYIWYKDLEKTPDIPMSEALRAEFTALAERIKKVKDVDEFPAIKETYDILKKKLVAENRKMGKNVVYTKELKEFIYWSIYHLLDVPAKKKEKSINTDENTADDEKKKTRQREKVSQNTAGWIFGLYKENPKKPKYHFNKIEKYDLYPIRSYKAFNKHEYISMIPNKTDTLGIRIAKVLNRGVLAPHVCRKTILVTNDLDVFANIESNDSKKYIMTIPDIEALARITDKRTKEEKVAQINYAYAGYLFAGSNNIVDDEKGRIFPSKVKECILSLINKEDTLVYDELLKKLFAENDDIAKYLKSGSSKLSEYRKYVKAVDYFNSFLEAEYEKENDEEDDGVPLYSEFYDAYVYSLDYDDKYTELLKRARKEVDDLYADLIDSFYAKRFFNDEGINFEEYIASFKKYIETNLFMVSADDNLLYKHNIPSTELVVKAAAVYWLTSVGASNENRDALIKWLKTGKLLKYFDSINQERVKSKSKKKEGGKTDEHLELQMSTIDWGSQLGTISNGRPALVYIDKKSYDIDASELAYLTSRGDCIIVIHGEEAGFNILDSDLQLCYKGGR